MQGCIIHGGPSACNGEPCTNRKWVDEKVDGKIARPETILSSGQVHRLAPHLHMALGLGTKKRLCKYCKEWRGKRYIGHKYDPNL